MKSLRLNPTEREWDWIDDGILPFALAAMRAIWIWLLFSLWARLIVPPHPEFASPLIIFFLLAASTLSAQWATFRLQGTAALVLVVGGGILGVALGIVASLGVAHLTDAGALLVLLVIGAWCWRWGILAAIEPLIFDTYARNFLYGVVGLALGVGIAFVTRIVSLSDFVLPILCFFAIGLGTLALSSLRDAQKYEQGRWGESFVLNRYWLGTVGAVVGLLLVVGLLISGAFAPGWAQQAISAILFLYNIFLTVILAIIYVIALVFFTALDLLGRVIHFTPSQGEPQPPQLLRPDQLFPPQPEAASQLPPWLFLTAQVAAVILIVLVLIVLFATAFRRFYQYTEENVAETRESIFTLDLLQQQLANLFRRGTNEKAKTAPFIGILGDDAAAQIRRLYQEFLSWSMGRGVTRQPGQTPNEFAEIVARILQLDVTAARVLTNLYLQARYSRASLSMRDVDRARDAWLAIARVDGAKT
jgi:hypothetical protein